MGEERLAQKGGGRSKCICRLNLPVNTLAKGSTSHYCTAGGSNPYGGRSNGSSTLGSGGPSAQGCGSDTTTGGIGVLLDVPRTRSKANVRATATENNKFYNVKPWFHIMYNLSVALTIDTLYVS